jgi:hypothetical protein
MSLADMAENLSLLLEVMAPFRSSCGLAWVQWGFEGSIVECHPPGCDHVVSTAEVF